MGFNSGFKGLNTENLTTISHVCQYTYFYFPASNANVSVDFFWYLSFPIILGSIVVLTSREDYFVKYMIWYIFNCNWVATRWQLFSTHIHTNNTGNVTKQTIQRTQKYIEQHKKIHRATQKLGRVRAVPRLCGFYPGICLTTEEKARKNLSQGSYT